MNEEDVGDVHQVVEVGDPPMGDWAKIDITGSMSLVEEILDYARHAATADHPGPCRFCGGGPSVGPEQESL